MDDYNRREDVIIAEWVWDDEGWKRCSDCGSEAEVDKWELDHGKTRAAETAFCPHCGARMRRKVVW